MLLKEEKKQGMTKHVIQLEQRKLANNMAKVEIAISDYIYNQNNASDRATSQLEIVLANSQEIDPQLLSQCYQKLSSWQFEYLESNKQTLEVKDEDYNRIVGFCSKATQIDPSNAAAWHIFSTTNDSASIYYSKKFAKQFRGHAQNLGLAG